MEFFLHNKDDQKSKALVNLATTFKINDINYIIYYNTQVEKTNIDIYIGKISYGDQSLVINKIDADQQQEFLNVVKEILAGLEPETELSDYKNIIDTATIILDTVQKIQIPTASLENLTKYHNEEVKEDSEENVNSQNNDNEEQNSTSDESVESTSNNDFDFDLPETNSDQEEKMKKEENSETSKEESKIENSVKDSDNVISSNDRLSELDNILNEKSEKEKLKKEKKQVISTPILLMLIFTIVISAILVFVGNMGE